MPRIKLLGLVNGGTTPLDGKYLVEYDPTRPGVAPDGTPMLAHIVVTDDPEKATCFGVQEAYEVWTRSNGIREDGRPNRPITAFSAEIS